MLSNPSSAGSYLAWAKEGRGLTIARYRHTLMPVGLRKRTSLWLDSGLSEGLKALKTRDGIPEAEAVRRAVAQYLRERGIEPTTETKAAPRRAVTRRKA